jgi:hypothetical protein
MCTTDSALTDAQSLINGFEQPVALVAHVRVIAIAVLARDFGSLAISSCGA